MEKARETKLKVLFISSEVAPFAKTGGLGDVGSSLPKAIAAHGHDVRVALPCYKFIPKKEYITDLPVRMNGTFETLILRRGRLSLPPRAPQRILPVYFVDNYKFFYREKIYGYPDEGERFNFFARAVLAMLPRLNFKPHVIHCNDWQTALIPLFLKTFFAEDPFYQNIATVFTIHNLQYQGLFPPEILPQLGLGPDFFHLEKLEFYGQVNFLKAGLLYADVINTVSKKYTLEVQTPAYGEGLDGVLRKRAADLYGIINGIDEEEWDPQKDPYLKVNYGKGSLGKKRENKRALQQELGLPQKDHFLIGVVSRLVSQKGLDLLAQIINQMMALELQLVLLGTGEDYYQELFSELKLRYPEKIAVKIGFDSPLAHRIYAGCDLFLMPSRFEPCGLGQLISFRYGTIPLARATGGLADTICDFQIDPARANGFLFQAYEAQALWETLLKAFCVYRKKPQAWHRLMVNAMKAKYTWENSAQEYLKLYDLALAKHRFL